jgi:hypothetical protein
MSDHEALVKQYEGTSTALLLHRLGQLEDERNHIHRKSGEELGWRNEAKLDKIMPRIIAIQEVLGDEVVARWYEDQTYRKQEAQA